MKRLWVAALACMSAFACEARLLLHEDADAYVEWAQSDAVAKRFP